MNGIEIWWWEDLVLILVGRVCLQEGLSRIWSSLDIIEVSWVNDVYLIHTSSLWLCEVMFSCCLALSFPPSEMTPFWSWRSMKWGEGEPGAVAEGLFSAVKGTHRFPFQSKQCHKSFVPHTVYFAPLIPWAGWLETSIGWKGTELNDGIIYQLSFVVVAEVVCRVVDSPPSNCTDVFIIALCTDHEWHFH